MDDGVEDGVKAGGKSAATALRALQVGYGVFGRVHARAWQRLLAPGALTIADPAPSACADALRDLPGVRVVADYREALAEADLVDIVCPADLHAAVAHAAFAAGRDVFVEKPAVTSTAKAHAVWQAAEASGRLIAVGYVLRQHPVTMALRQALPACGAIHTIEADFVALKPPRADTGVVLNDAIHFLDLLVWLLGGPPREVTAMLADHLGRGLEDRAMIVMRWPGGALARLTASCLIAGTQRDPYVIAAGAEKRLLISGDRGQLHADLLAGTLQSRGCRIEAANGRWQVRDTAAETTRFPQPSAEDMVAAELATFCCAVRTRQRPDNGDRDAVVGMAALIDAIFRSAAERRTIELPR